MDILATILISVENFEDGDITREINSPRSLESCLRTGLDPSELHPKSFDKLGSRHLRQEMIDIKHDYFEKKRRGKTMPQQKHTCHCLMTYIADLDSNRYHILFDEQKKS